MKIYENKILRILGFVFIWIYVFGVGICFAAKWYAIGISGAILLVVWLNSGLIGDAIYRYRIRQATKQIKKCGIRLFVDLSQCKVTAQKSHTKKSRMQEPIFGVLNSSEIQFWNNVSGHLFPDIYHREQIVSTAICTVTYTTKYNGKTKTFRSDAILMEKVSLEMLLQHYGTATIYINPKNAGQYYFDLDFLKQIQLTTQDNGRAVPC